MGALRIGIVGTGSISDFHLKSYAANPNCAIAAICDKNEERAAAAARRYGAGKVYGDADQMFADPDIDAVSVCTWNNTHAELSVAALRAGKHVLVEKPLATNVADALRIEAAVRETGKTLMVGFVRRYDENARMIKRFIDEGDFGELYYAKASTLRRNGNPGGWFADRECSGGGPLIDIGVHVIDLCWYLMGRPKPVTVSANTYRHLGNRANVKYMSTYKAADYDPSYNTVEDMANALIRFENGASLNVDVSFSLHAKKNESAVKLYGTRGGFELEPETSIVTEKYDTMLNVMPQTDTPALDMDRAFRNEIDHFLACCLTGEKPISSVEDGVAVMRMLCGVYESAEKRAEIRL
ncbi:Gfo/Idh/MocA family oxidoreductase [Paenibacillus sp. TRM 82003]|nr:Gfo/Idh/MocA family oxidoreductase [Paenibacillus sp. TRM 82003]